MERDDAPACTLCAFLHLECQVIVNYETTAIITSVRVTIFAVEKQEVLRILSVCVCSFSLCSFGNFPGVRSIKADVSELNVGSIVLGDQE